VEKIKTNALKHGYSLIISDMQSNNTSLLDGRVGTDNFDIRKPNESAIYIVLSFKGWHSFFV